MNEQQKEIARIAIDRAFELADGSPTKLAQLVSQYQLCSRQQAYNWKKVGLVGHTFAKSLYNALKGQIGLYELRPDWRQDSE